MVPQFQIVRPKPPLMHVPRGLIDWSGSMGEGLLLRSTLAGCTDGKPLSGVARHYRCYGAMRISETCCPEPEPLPCSQLQLQGCALDMASARCVTLGTSAQHVDQHTVSHKGLAAASAEDPLGMSASVVTDAPAALPLTDAGREQEWDSIHASGMEPECRVRHQGVIAVVCAGWY